MLIKHCKVVYIGSGRKAVVHSRKTGEGGVGMAVHLSISQSQETMMSCKKIKFLSQADLKCLHKLTELVLTS